jgi:PAS domain S-box-containing protein
MSMNSPLLATNQDEMMSMSEMMGGDSLDDIIQQNSKELHRRQSMPQQQYVGALSGDDMDQTGQMMEFGLRNNHLSSFQFGQNSGADGLHDRQISMDNLDMISGFADMSASMGLDNGHIGFSSSMHDRNPLAIDNSNNYGMLGNIMPYDMDISGGTTPINIFAPQHFQNPFASAGNMGQMPSDFTMPMVNQDEQGISDSNRQHDTGNGDADAGMMNTGLNVERTGNSIEMPEIRATHQGLTGYNSPIMARISPIFPKEDPYQQTLAEPEVSVAPTPRSPERPPKPSMFANVYSSSGFDMLGALMRVATRKNPEINIGAVDMSCAFVVCDVTEPDCPIVYVSDIFERLTGYNKHEVLGRNCRFLQAPDGKVMAGVKRKYVDDETVHYLKSRIKQHKEAQRSLINYRKGGQPFMNLLTMIPIAWDTEDIKYIVGFQVDLVEQPSSVAGKGEGGSYTVNYSQGTLPRYVWTPPSGARPPADSGQTISRDEVSSALINFNTSTESELTKRMRDKVLLENTDDVVHVLSLKGLFLYLSPSARHVLEYDASELVGTALSSVCHPSDIVPVTRELKDTSTGAAVNVVFRIRRKRSGYTWFESHGALCVEQGKGRKCIILVGRERPVYALARHDIENAGGIGESELWTKLSTSGMFLFVSSNVRTLLDRQPDDLVGTSIQALMRVESKVEFGRCLERARTGKRVTYKHEVMNKRGQALQAQTTLYPGDATEGSKPTFLVAQTRLLKASSRGIHTSFTPHQNAKAAFSGEDGISEDSGALSALSSALNYKEVHGDGTPRSSASTLLREHVLTQAGGAGLAIGSQDAALASADNIFDELKTTRCTSWQFELRQMEKSNRLLAEELASLLQNKKKRKRRKGNGHLQRDCANCHTRVTPEWRRGPSGNRDLCNSCGLRWAKQVSRENSETSGTLEQNAKKSNSDSSLVLT